MRSAPPPATVPATIREWVLRLWGTLTGRRTDDDLERELQVHLELAEESLRRQGHSPSDAAREARVRFGSSTRALEPLRDQRGVPFLGSSWLDVKLGLRMLRKHWGLTLVGGLAMTVAITIGASVFDFLNGISGTALPLDEGHRVVIIQPWDPEAGQEHPSSLEDFERWRDDLQSVVDVGAFRTVQRNLVTADGPTGPVRIAEMTASGFQVARVAPLLGRFFSEDDEAAGAPPVVVIGYDVWRSRFFADPEVVGRHVQLAGTDHTVIGVMPEAFAFPLNHSCWTPLRTNRSAYTQPADARVVVFARLAPGVALERADAEVAAGTLRDPAAVSRSGEPLTPRVVPYVYGTYGGEDLWLVHLIQILVVLILLPPCANIAVLIYARTVARQGEFAVRTALGATRGRIVAQIFLEVLLLAAGSAAVALVLARQVVAALRDPFVQQAFGGLPFWMDFSLSYRTILYVAGLAVVAATIAGGIPALRATGHWTQSGLQALGSRTTPRLGKVWTAVVVAQVALSVAALPTAVQFGWWTLRSAVLGPGFAAGEFLTARMVLMPEAPQPPGEVRSVTLRAELVRRLAAEPGVAAVTVSAATPSEEPVFRIAVEEPDRGVRRVSGATRLNQVDRDFFDTFDVPLLAGRAFEPADFEPGGHAILVNRTFAESILGRESPLGRRVRFIGLPDGPDLVPAARDDASAPWYDIVGVVADLSGTDAVGRTIFRPLSPVAAPAPLPFAGPADPAQAVQPITLTIRSGSPAPDASGGLARRLQEIVTALDPDLRIDRVRTLEEIYEAHIVGDILGGSALAAVMLAVLLVSAAGVYTLTSFTVTQRRREIGLRSALGAQPWRLVAGLFRSVLLPVAAGAALGGVAALVLNRLLSEILLANAAKPIPWILPAAEALIVVVGVIILAGPARRIVRVEATDALKEG